MAVVKMRAVDRISHDPSLEAHYYLWVRGRVYIHNSIDEQR